MTFRPGDRVRVTKPKPDHQRYAGMTGEVQLPYWPAPTAGRLVQVMLDHTSGSEEVFEEEELETERR